MTNIIIQISKYIIILLMAAYTFSCFSIFTRNYEDEEKRVLIRQDVLLFLLQMVSFFAMYTAKKDLRILFIYAALAVVILGVILLYNLIYPQCIEAGRQQYVYADHCRNDHDHPFIRRQ